MIVMTRKFHIGLMTVLALLLCACTQELMPDLERQDAPGVFLKASLLNPTPDTLSGKTKAKDDDDSSVQAAEAVAAMESLRETYIGSLDIFVKESSAANTAPWFKTYHLLPDNAETGFTGGEDILLHENWAEAGYRPGVSYDIYVAANNPHTAAGVAPANLSGLLALQTTDNELFKYYSADGSTPYGMSHITTYPNSHEKAAKKKEFRMDCLITNWMIDPDSARQVWDAQLQRDVAKIIVRVHYGDQKNIALVKEDGSDAQRDTETGKIKQGSLKEYLQYIGRTSVGTPRWKYNNFCFTDGDFAAAGLDDGADIRSYGSTLAMSRDDAMDPASGDYWSIENLEQWHYTLVTYSAPFSWGTHTEKTPFVLFSVMFTNPGIPEGDANRGKLYYYRLPVCDERHVQSLERNHIYIVDVSICSLGSEYENLRMEDSELNVEYHVIPWTEQAIAQNASTTVVTATDTQFLSVSPQEFTLKGNDTQSVTLNYFASVSTADKRFLDIENYRTQLKVEFEDYTHGIRNITGTVTKTPSAPDGKGNIVFTSQAPGSEGTPDGTSGTQGEKVTVTITPDGHITVVSEALANRAVKKITFTVTLLTSGFSKTVVVQHAPLDNIKNIQGAWSSRTGTIYRERTGNVQWDSPNVEWEYYSSETTDTRVPCTYDVFKTVLTQKESNATRYYRRFNNMKDDELNQYFGTSNRDYIVNNFLGIDNAHYYEGYYYFLDVYDNRYYMYYADEFWYYRQRYFELSETFREDWVRWGSNLGKRYVKDGYFVAKHYNENTGTIRYVQSGNGFDSNAGFLGGQAYYITGMPAEGEAYGANNRQMYVIQLTSSSSEYVIGYPKIDNFGSEDNVVSPAFMLASQLGAMTVSGNGATYEVAKTHCGTYLEVDKDGYEYRNWRLPTQAEINVIIKYQSNPDTQDITMASVLTGRYYWALDGTSVLANTADNRNVYWVRCVRDLTLEELNALNQQ